MPTCSFAAEETRTQGHSYKLAKVHSRCDARLYCEIAFKLWIVGMIYHRKLLKSQLLNPSRVTLTGYDTARLVTGTRRCECITLALRQLHWLPVQQWIQYKLASLAFRSLSRRLSAGCTFRAETPAVSGATRLPCQNSTFGDRSFAATGPRTWNELPFSLRDTGLSRTTFNEHLKTYLFSIAFWDHGAFVTFMIYLCRV